MSAARTGRQCQLDSRSSFESQQICGTKFVRSAVFSFVVCFVIAGRGYAAQTDTSAKQKESPPVRVDVPQPSQQFPNALPAGAEVPAAGYPTTSAQQSVNSSTSSRRGEFVIAPIPFSNEAFSFGIVPFVDYVFQLDQNDKKSPPSSLVVAGMLATGKSWAFGGGANLYIKEDRFRFLGLVERAASAMTSLASVTRAGTKARPCPYAKAELCCCSSS